MRVRYHCAHCQTANSFESSDQREQICGGCGRVMAVSDVYANGKLSACAMCGNHQLYRMKDFPQWLGMGLLATACVLFYVFAIRYQYAIAWSILLGSAAVDAAIYLIVGDVVVCYRCGAQHRGLRSKAFDPHEIAIAEKYRQERIRLEQLQAVQRDTNRVK